MANGETGTSLFQEFSNSDLGILDFMDNETNLDQFFDLIQEDQNIASSNPVVNFNSQLFDFDNQNTDGGCLVDSNLFSELFDFNDFATKSRIRPDCSTENEVEEGESSATTTNTPEKKQKKSYRSRTLISERRRRGRMKEKLFTLRSLVPNITKMDKASIIGDAVLYVQDLQMQAKKLKSEIAALESQFTNNNNISKSTKTIATTPSLDSIVKIIFKMDVIQLEEGGLYVRIVCKKGKGVAAILLKALHTLTTVKTSNLATDHDAQNYVCTFTLHIAEEENMNSSSLKIWVARAFLAQGFVFETLPNA